MKIYRFNYSCYCLKVEKALDIVGLKYEKIQVPYLDRKELVRVTDGYIQVPVVVEDDGNVIKDSKNICEELAKRSYGETLVPKGLEAVIWAYHDWCDNQLEDVMFRLAAPLVLKTHKTEEDRAFYVFIKERKYGKGCINEWENNSASLLRTARELLGPTEAALNRQEFVIGNSPTLADAALYGQFAMWNEVGLPIEKDFGTTFSSWFKRISFGV